MCVCLGEGEGNLPFQLHFGPSCTFSPLLQTVYLLTLLLSCPFDNYKAVLRST